MIGHYVILAMPFILGSSYIYIIEISSVYCGNDTLTWFQLCTYMSYHVWFNKLTILYTCTHIIYLWQISLWWLSYCHICLSVWLYIINPVSGVWLSIDAVLISNIMTENRIALSRISFYPIHSTCTKFYHGVNRCFTICNLHSLWSTLDVRIWRLNSIHNFKSLKITLICHIQDIRANTRISEFQDWRHILLSTTVPVSADKHTERLLAIIVDITGPGVNLNKNTGRVQLNCLILFFIHLKLELLTQFPVSNDEKYNYFWKKNICEN